MFEPGSRGWRRSKGGGNGDRGRRGMEGKPASKFSGGRGTTSVSLCIFWHKAELTSRRKWWRSSLVHGAFNGLILRPNFISFSVPRKFFAVLQLSRSLCPPYFQPEFVSSIINLPAPPKRRVNCKCNRDLFGGKKKKKGKGRRRWRWWSRYDLVKCK